MYGQSVLMKMEVKRLEVEIGNAVVFFSEEIECSSDEEDVSSCDGDNLSVFSDDENDDM